MKKSFTLIEAVIVIVVLGILATITSKILVKVYENYLYSKELNKLSYQTDLILNKLAAKLSFRVANSVIAVECNITNDDCYRGNIYSFKALSSITSDIDKYKVLEWLGKDIYAKRGMWNSTLQRVVPGYSGFVDLNQTTSSAFGDEYNITTPYSYFGYVKEIDSNWTEAYGIRGDVFDNNYTVLIFSGPDDRGDFLDINHSYGYYENKYPSNKAMRVFHIYNPPKSIFNDTTGYSRLNIKAIDESNSTTVYEKYYLINSAYAIVPRCNKDKNGNCVDYNLTLFYNYYPWNKQAYYDVGGGKEANHSLLAAHITQFKFREENGVLRIFICVDNPNIKINNEPITVCKEKVVF
jgi:Tfp pilus assembly major pilin PilA